MLIDHVNSTLEGSVALAARRLHHELLTQGLDSRFWFAHASGGSLPDESYSRLPWPVRRPRSLWDAPAMVGRRARWYGVRRTMRRQLGDAPPPAAGFSVPLGKHATPYRRDWFQGDLLHLHSLSQHVDFPTFFSSVPRDLPIVWTIDDMNPVTGGCHFADDCTAFHQQCRYCPLLADPGPEDLSSSVFQVKREAYPVERMHVVATSEWLERSVCASELLGGAASIRTIRRGVDTLTFRPIDKRAARFALGLDPDCYWIAFGADNIAAPAQGAGDFLVMLRNLPGSQRIHGLLFGQGQLPPPESGVHLHHFGYQRSPEQLALIYSAADLFVVSSHFANLPQTAVESMSCGTPVIAYDVGGLGELITSGENGWLVGRHDPAELARRVRWMLDQPRARQQFAQAARRRIERDFDQRELAAAYAALYEHLLVRPALALPRLAA